MHYVKDNNNMPLKLTIPRNFTLPPQKMCKNGLL